MMPIIPHLTSECLSKIDKKRELAWPILNKDYLDSEEKEIVQYRRTSI